MQQVTSKSHNNKDNDNDNDKNSVKQKKTKMFNQWLDKIGKVLHTPQLSNYK